MNFKQIAARFEQAESGSDSFKQLSRDAFESMKTDVDNAALYFLIGVAARSYVSRYEDQGVSGEFADRAKAVLVGYNDRLIAALGADAQTRLHVLGEVAVDYEWQVSDF